MIDVACEGRGESVINNIAKDFDSKIADVLINEGAAIETLIIDDVLITDKRIIIARSAFLKIIFTMIFF